MMRVLAWLANNLDTLTGPSPPHAALTHSNVLRELKELNWDILSKGYYTIGVLELPSSQRNRIEKMYVSEEERKSEGVLFWVDHHPLASWRLLIRQLDKEKIYSLANQIHQYAEKVTGWLSSILYCH